MVVSEIDLATRTKFEGLFKNPTIERLLENLTWQEFEDFVQYVFECAGYTVFKVASRPKYHVDLHLYAKPRDRRPTAVVEVRRYHTARIPAAKVLMFIGAVKLAGASKGYLVTTAGFTEPAIEVAEHEGSSIGLINGDHLLRYISYVRGSVVTDEHGMVAGPVKTGPLSPSYLLDADKLPRLAPQNTAVVAVANSKGGVGKTTTALYLGWALSQKQRVLDSQAR